MKGNSDFSKEVDAFNERLEELTRQNGILALSRVVPYLGNVKLSNKDSFIEEVNRLNKLAQESIKPVCLMLDEADKAPHEVLQPLLELLQFHTLNGRKIAIKSCVLTCNLPDERAHTEKLSHAITNRSFIYKMRLDFNIWRKWAVNNGVYPLISGFISQKQQLLHQPPSNNDDTAYAHPSPRAWTDVSGALFDVDNDPVFKNLSPSQQIDLKTTIIAGKVGQVAAMEFEMWLKHYQTLDPIMTAIAENGTHPNMGKYDLEQQLILTIGACQRINNELKPKNKGRITKVCSNVFEVERAMAVPFDVIVVRSPVSNVC